VSSSRTHTFSATTKLPEFVELESTPKATHRQEDNTLVIVFAKKPKSESVEPPVPQKILINKV